MSSFILITDPDHETKGFYRLLKTNNKQQTITILNTHRAQKDIKEIGCWTCSDQKKAEGFIREALKAKYIPGSTEWIKLTPANVSKTVSTIATLINIVNGSDEDE